MARKTREDFERERQARARVDLVRAARGGGARGRYASDAADGEADALRVKHAGGDWKPKMPIGFGWLPRLLLLASVAFLGYLAIAYGLN